MQFGKKISAKTHLAFQTRWFRCWIPFEKGAISFSKIWCFTALDDCLLMMWSTSLRSSAALVGRLCKYGNERQLVRIALRTYSTFNFFELRNRLHFLR